MPEYQYKCKECSTIFAVIRPITAITTITCPNCKSENIQQQYFAPKIIYKGKGFYVTDNAKKDKSNP
jgi:putative FmdB family regulatory protein